MSIGQWGGSVSVGQWRCGMGVCQRSGMTEAVRRSAQVSSGNGGEEKGEGQL